MAARFRVLDNGTLRDITRLSIRQAGVTRRIRTLKVMDGGVLRLVGKFADPLAVAAPPQTGGAEFAGGGKPQLVSAVATAAPTGGFPPYSYAWTHIGGDVFSVSQPTNASTTFYATLVAPDSKTGTYRVTVTDAMGDTAAAHVTVFLILNVGF